MRLLAMVEDPANVARFLARDGRGDRGAPPLAGGVVPRTGKSRVLRRQTLGEEDDGQGRWVQETA